MPPHSMGSGTISFGLVSIPVRMYTAASGTGVSFNQLHEKCGSRIKQQIFCPVCNETVERSQLVVARIRRGRREPFAQRRCGCFERSRTSRAGGRSVEFRERLVERLWIGWGTVQRPELRPQ